MLMRACQSFIGRLKGTTKVAEKHRGCFNQPMPANSSNAHHACIAATFSASCGKGMTCGFKLPRSFVLNNGSSPCCRQANFLLFGPLFLGGFPPCLSLSGGNQLFHGSATTDGLPAFDLALHLDRYGHADALHRLRLFSWPEPASGTHVVRKSRRS